MEHVSVCRNEINSVYDINNHRIKINRNYKNDIPAPLVLVSENKHALIHNINISDNSDKSITLSFEMNDTDIWIYDVQGNSVSFATDDLSVESDILPKYLITLDLIDLDKRTVVIKQTDKLFECFFFIM